MMTEEMNLAKKRCVPCRGDAVPLRGQPLETLYQQLGNQWKVVNEHHLEKEYLFSDFAQALAFTNSIGKLAEEEKHHPDIFLSYGKVRVQLWTHKIEGLTETDFIFAAKCDTFIPKKERE